MTAGIDGAVVASGLAAGMGNGRVALVSGFHTAFFDNVTVQTTKSKQAAAIYSTQDHTGPSNVATTLDSADVRAVAFKAAARKRSTEAGSSSLNS